MRIIHYFESPDQPALAEKLSRSDWGAAKFLLELLREGKFFDTLGGQGELYLLMEGDELLSFLTLTRQDCIRDESMFPWVGFVYTFPQYRGCRYAGKLLDHAVKQAGKQGFPRVYLATDHEGLYEKYGFTYLENRISCWGDDDRVLFRDTARAPMKLETDRLTITQFSMDMAEAVHLNSLDADNRRFVPDEVFETVEEAADTLEFLIGCCQNGGGPLVYPALLKDGTYVGYVQAVPLEDGSWEVGYHIGGAYTGNGYATEALRAFLPVILPRLGITGIAGLCLAENRASQRVLEHCGFELLFRGPGDYQGREQEICRYIYRS